MKKSYQNLTNLLKHKDFLPTFIIFLTVLIYLPSLTNFFSSDDWFHLRISNIKSLSEFINFFSFARTDQSAAFYRPLPTQAFFFLQKFFGLNPVPFHLVSLSVFITSLVFVYKVSLKLFEKYEVSVLVLFFYAFSATHMTRLYFLSAFQEILMFLFCLLAIYFYLLPKRSLNYFLSLVFFALALLSKETAVVIPLILLLISWYKKTSFKKTLFFWMMILFYIYLRFFVFGIVVGDSYVWDFSIKRAFNTLFWYFSWSLGVPEMLVDYVSSGLRILPAFFKQFYAWSLVILPLILLNISLVVISFLRSNRFSKMQTLGLGIFLVAILPVIFLPWHKFTLELTLPMFGTAIFLATLNVGTKIKRLGILYLIAFLALNLATIVLTYQTHYVISRAKVSQKVIHYLNQNHPRVEKGSYFVFVNGTSESSQNWGISKQIAQSISYSDLFRVFYNQNIEVHYEDLTSVKPGETKAIYVNSLDILKR
jgi:hypothetical protein